MATTQALLDKHKATLQANGFYITVGQNLAHLVNPISIRSFIGQGEMYILHDNMQDFLLCGRWNEQSFTVGDKIEAIPSSAFHIYLGHTFRSGSARLYILNQVQPAINEAAYKYEMIPAVYQGNKLYRIRAIKDFGDVKAGELGGYIESGKNLEQKGHCWVYGNAQVTENARVSGNAKILDNAKVTDDSIVTDNAQVSKNAIIWGKSEISGRAEISGQSQLVGSKVYGQAKVNILGLIYECDISGKSSISGKPSLHSTTISGNAEIYGECKIIGSTISGNAKVFDKCEIEKSEIYENARVFQMCVVRRGVKIFGNAEVSGNAVITNDVKICDKAIVNGTPWIDGSEGEIIIKGKTNITSGEITSPVVLNESKLVVAGGEIIQAINEAANKKYELVEQKHGKTKYRVRALRNFGKVKAGTIGGFVDGEHNLSHDGLCWIQGNAAVAGNAQVFENAIVDGEVIVNGNAKVYGNAKVNNDCYVGGNAQVRGKSHLYGRVQVYDKAIIEGNSYLKGNAQVYGSARIKTGVIQDWAKVFGNIVIDWETIIGGHVEVKDKTGDAFVNQISLEFDPHPLTIGDVYKPRRERFYPRTNKELSKMTSEYSYKELVDLYGKKGADNILKAAGVM